MYNIPARSPLVSQKTIDAVQALQDRRAALIDQGIDPDDVVEPITHVGVAVTSDSMFCTNTQCRVGTFTQKTGHTRRNSCPGCYGRGEPV